MHEYNKSACMSQEHVYHEYYIRFIQFNIYDNNYH